MDTIKKGNEEMEARIRKNKTLILFIIKCYPQFDGHTHAISIVYTLSMQRLD